MEYQKTLARVAAYTGIGLHSGRDVSIKLNPAPPNTGIVFVRVDLPNAPQVKASAWRVTNTLRATTLEDKEAKVFTVEHLLAALFGLEIDNCIVELDSPEPPLGDGSALTFVQMIQQAGIEVQNVLCKYTVVHEAQTVTFPDRFIAVLPYDGLRITFTSMNPHPLLGVQCGDYEITPETFVKELAPARTIGFMNEVEALKKQGLGLGGTIETVVVYDEEKSLTPLRFADELVRHKILDVVGDLALAGKVRGHIVALKSGHALNTVLAKKILESVKH